MKGKFLKRLLTGVAAAAMCVSMMASTAMAATAEQIGTGNGTINVTVYDTQEGNTGDGVTAPTDTTKPVSGVGIEYRRIGSVAQVTTEAGTQVAFGIDTAYAGIVAGKTAIATVDGVSYYDPADVQAAVQAADKAALEALATEGTGTTNDAGNVSFTVAAGLYLLTKSELPANATTNVDPFLVAVPMYINGAWSSTVQVYPKVRIGTPIEPEKTVGQGYDIVNAGETIPFTITTPVAAAERTFETFKYVDKNPGQTLTIDMDSLAVKLGDTPLTKDVDYSVSSAVNEGANETTIEFITEGLKKLNAGIAADQIVTITYNATINTTDGNLVTDINNTARLTYERDGDAAETHSDDTVTIHTYGINLTKTLSDGADVAANAVKFELRKGSAEGTPIAMTTNNGQYWVAANGASGTTTELTVAAGGSLKLNGLDEGTYYLTETATASGYTKLDKPIVIVITPNANAGEGEETITATVDDVTANVDGGAVNLTVENTKNESGFTLPQTGGAGTLFVTIIGVGLIAAAVILLAVSRKKAQR